MCFLSITIFPSFLTGNVLVTDNFVKLSQMEKLLQIKAVELNSLCFMSRTSFMPSKAYIATIRAEMKFGRHLLVWISSGVFWLWRRVVLQVVTNVSQERIASIFRVKSFPKIQATRSSETLVTTYKTTLRHTHKAAIYSFAVSTSDISLDLEYVGNETHPTEGEYLPCRLEPGLDRSLFLARRAGDDWWDRDSGLTITALGLAGDGSCKGSLPGTTPVQLKRHALYRSKQKAQNAHEICDLMAILDMLVPTLVVKAWTKPWRCAEIELHTF
jgi:hypothetical protein